MNNYKPNSRASKTAVPEKEEKKRDKIDKVVKGCVKTKKKNGFLNMLLADEIVDMKTYIICDVLIPAAKKAIDEIVSNGKDILLYGETGRSKKTVSNRVSYRSYYEREDRDRDRDRPRSRSSTYSYDDIILETRAEAEDVINKLDEVIDMYGMASVLDLYDIVGISGQHTDNKYGWTDVCNASHVRVRDGYKLKLPRARPLN